MENAYKLLDGRKIAADMHSEIAADVSSLADAGWPLKLVSISIGESDAAKLYVRNQSRTAKKTGIDFEERDYPADTTEKELLGIIQGPQHRSAGDRDHHSTADAGSCLCAQDCSARCILSRMSKACTPRISVPSFTRCRRWAPARPPLPSTS